MSEMNVQNAMNQEGFAMLGGNEMNEMNEGPVMEGYQSMNPATLEGGRRRRRRTARKSRKGRKGRKGRKSVRKSRRVRRTKNKSNNRRKNSHAGH